MRVRFTDKNLPELFRALEKYCQPGREYILDVCQKRTLNQNAYYYSVIVPLFMDVTGYSRRTAHEKLAKMFLTEYKDSKGRVKSTADLTTIEFENYLQDIRIHLYHDYRVITPWPNDVDDQLIFDLEKVVIY